MKPIQITVYEYINDDDMPNVLEVNAFCVGGREGVFAVFRMLNSDQLIGFASGDDGHWQLTETHHVHWISGIAEVISMIKEHNHGK